MNVKFSECELEDYLVDHLDLIDPNLHFIGRQVPIHGGRLDILAIEPGGFVIIELKIATLDDAAFGQALRYQYSFTPTFYTFHRRVQKLRIAEGMPHEDCDWLQEINVYPPVAFSKPVRTILVGPSIDNSCCDEANYGPIEVWLYSVSLEGLSLAQSWYCRSKPVSDMYGTLYDWINIPRVEYRLVSTGADNEVADDGNKLLESAMGTDG